MFGLVNSGVGKFAKRIRNTPEQIIVKLREAEVYLSHGNTMEQACKTSGGGSEQAHYHWRREYGGKEYNTIRPRNSLGYQPPAPESILIPSTQFYQPTLT